jgi:pyoverdine/dityrosine biosynthesis protein Dit1
MSVASEISVPIKIKQDFDKILQVLLPYQRSDDRHVQCGHSDYRCFSPQFAQLLSFIAENAPVFFTLPAFPCKRRRWAAWCR